MSPLLRVCRLQGAPPLLAWSLPTDGPEAGFTPGLSGVTGMAIFLPFAVGMDPFPALMFFAGLGAHRGSPVR